MKGADSGSAIPNGSGKERTVPNEEGVEESCVECSCSCAKPNGGGKKRTVPIEAGVEESIAGKWRSQMPPKLKEPKPKLQAKLKMPVATKVVDEVEDDVEQAKSQEVQMQQRPPSHGE